MAKRGKIITPAPIWKRALAYFFDLLIINLFVITPLSPIINKQKFNIAQISAEIPKELTIVLIVILSLSLFYWIALEYLLQQSIGKYLMKIKLENTPTLHQVILRNLTKPFPLILLIDTLYMTTTKEKVRLFEKWSHTRVIEAN